MPAEKEGEEGKILINLNGEDGLKMNLDAFIKAIEAGTIICIDLKTGRVVSLQDKSVSFES